MSSVNRPKPTRSQRAAETRRRMLDAAIACFTAAGYAGSTMAAIAEQAGVAVQTLYFTFHTKAQLLQETLDRAVLGDGAPVPPPQTPWYKAMQAQDTVRPALEHLVTGVTQIMERVAPLGPVFEAAAAEPGVAEVWASAERLRLEGYRAIIDLLAAKQPLAAGHTPDSATDVLFVLLGPGTFRAFTHDRGWRLEQWKAWVTTTLEHDLFSQPAPPAP
ncbi:MAG: TetR/AcrR family transcriptional regulator [Micromonosporaceae bacterium]